MSTESRGEHSSRVAMSEYRETLQAITSYLPEALAKALKGKIPDEDLERLKEPLSAAVKEVAPDLAQHVREANRNVYRGLM